MTETNLKNINKEYQKGTTLSSCELLEGDLLKLEKILKDDCPQDCVFKIQATHGGSIIYSSNNVLDFLKIEDLPEKISSLEITCSNQQKPTQLALLDKGQKTKNDNSQVEKFSARVFFAHDEVFVIVEGAVLVQVLGVFSHIEWFLKRKSSKFVLLRKLFANNLVLSIIVGVIITFFIKFVTSLDFIYIILSSISASYLIINYILWIFQGKNPPNNIYIRSQKKTFSTNINWIDFGSLLIALISLVITMIQVLIK